MSTWTEDVVTGLENLDGIAPLADIYSELRKIRPDHAMVCLPHEQLAKSVLAGCLAL